MEPALKRVAIVICYIGQWPWYFRYFMHTCKYNPTIDFLILTDNLGYSKDIPPNVKFIHTTLSELSKIATKKLGFNVNILYGYKLCDFKPTYGLLFSEILEDYDFWGHGDIDVFFGNIRNFLTVDILDNYDIISARHDFLTGYFLLFRNIRKMNSLFTLSKDYKNVLCSNTHFCFDETNHHPIAFAKALEEGKPQDEVITEIESMMHVVKKMEKQGYIKAYFDCHAIEGFNGKLKWEKGNLFYKNKYEILLYHLILFKGIYTPIKEINIMPEIFTISPTRIYHK